MSEKSPSLMIKTILGHLESGLEKLESGQLSPEDMELLVEDAKELYERMVIMRYKIYETNVLGVSAPVVSASIRQPEIETPIDLFGAIDLGSEPEFEVTFANEDPIIDEEKVSYPLEEEVEEELGFKNEILEDVIETEKESNFEKFSKSLLNFKEALNNLRNVCLFLLKYHDTDIFIKITISIQNQFLN